ncbi:MAG: biotin/lipoate A/B protein ligase family protein [Microbacterium sp.]|jgi:lipoate-protein ligase A|uniref:lipoate--protein ligase family protein n=1 Tax=Microbacterium TaxID=33882 RepID=UPI000C5395F9|nr:biotin/lipoate A/B protein ligase family protein [Microbacterium sp.]MEC8762546.1 biotin/lipoate A/B protein ligase family protein [Actinomycetota bacterium]MBU19901.1 lipoate--protein ligase [Microbacterium sp.]RCL85603.1 MAG: lipoate--protein ligase family protein [Microbacterium sp.]HAM12546.1 lipoate--protein ligase [Microbacterium sp.]HCU78686.1 lipoate--protein ligase [Microbacterium sp.]|tara:strand:+ start:174 stop:1223 length:1050 start_codon:yes stop_codon:yes gene_type:complete
MHAEYKVPGGKLVVVDLDVEAGRLANVRLAGDFFLEPDDALGAINAAVSGLPSEADVPTIAAAVRAALPDGAQLLGFTPEAVGTVVRRALVTASGWKDFSWQIVHDRPVSPRMNLALDEVLTTRVGDGRRMPTLRLWEWNESAVVIGSFQSYRNEVDPEGARRHGYDVVRRISGGGAMLMGADAIITYSLSVPASLVAGMTFADSYAFLDDWVLQALRSLGIDATYQPLNDIASPEGKIGGAAQKRLANGGVLHHATLSYDMDGEVLTDVLRIGREKLSDKGTTSAAKRVDPLRRQTGLPREAIIQAFADTFTTLYGAEVGHITEEEYAEAEALVASKFATDAWLHRVP